MAKDQTVIDTGIWKDPYFRSLSSAGQLIYIHAAFFDKDPQVIALECNISIETVQEYLARPDFQKSLEKYYG